MYTKIHYFEVQPLDIDNVNRIDDGCFQLIKLNDGK